MNTGGNWEISKNPKIRNKNSVDTGNHISIKSINQIRRPVQEQQPGPERHLPKEEDTPPFMGMQVRRGEEGKEDNEEEEEGRGGIECVGLSGERSKLKTTD